MDKSTKCCELKVYIKNGQLMTGLLHTSMRTSSAIRPSDAIMERKNLLLLLSDVTILEPGGSRQVDAVILPYDAISHIELPTGWNARPNQEDSSGPVGAAPVAHHRGSSGPSRQNISKWLVGGGQPPR